MEISKRDLAALHARRTTKTALAHKLGISPTYLMRITPPLPLGPVVAQRKAQSKLATSRKAHRERLAIKVVAGKSIEKAAVEANCSVRTMYRYVCRLTK